MLYLYSYLFIYIYIFAYCFLSSVLWHCWLGGRKGIRPVKTEWWGAGMVICLELMPLPLTVSCFSKIQIGFTYLVPAHLGSPGQRAVKCACVRACFLISVISVTFSWLWTTLKACTMMHSAYFCCQFEGSTLYITDARPEDRGLYLCEVENSAGQSYASVVVEVESKF